MEWNPIHEWDRTADFLKGLAKTLPAPPKAIVMVSAHWLESSVSVTGSPSPELLYDYYGFPAHTYELQYPAKGEPLLAKAIVQRLNDAGVPASMNSTRGFDHGMFIPMLLMFPNADIPVVQLSMPTSDPVKLIELGRRLRPLRDEGVLIIGSGFMTHGLPFIRDWRVEAAAPGWSAEFDLWAKEALDRGDIESLINYKSLAPGMPYAHPTVEHFTPLFITLGAATNPEDAPDNKIAGYFMGLSKRSIQVA